jgi:hypothetical protein
MALSSISQSTESPVYQPYAPVPAVIFTTDPSAPAAAPIIAKANAGTTAAQPDSGDASSVIAKLGANTAGAQTYNASGLLNLTTQAGQASMFGNTSAANDSPAYDQDLSDLMVVSAHGATAGASNSAGIYTPSGDMQDLPIYAAKSSSGSIVNTQA